VDTVVEPAAAEVDIASVVAEVDTVVAAAEVDIASEVAAEVDIASEVDIAFEVAAEVDIAFEVAESDTVAEDHMVLGLHMVMFDQNIAWQVHIHTGPIPGHTEVGVDKAIVASLADIEIHNPAALRNRSLDSRHSSHRNHRVNPKKGNFPSVLATIQKVSHRSCPKRCWD